MASNKRESTLLRRFAKRQFEKCLARHTRAQGTPPYHSKSSEETNDRNKGGAGQKVQLPLESYNHRFRLVLDSREGLQGFDAYKFVPLEQKSSSSSSTSKRGDLELVTSRKPLPLITLPTPETPPALAAAQNKLPVVHCPPLMVNVEPPSVQLVQRVKVEGEKAQNRQTNMLHSKLQLERPSTARSNVSRRSARSRRVSVYQKDHWVDNLTISEPDEPRQETLKFRKKSQSAMLKARRAGVDEYCTRLPSFICPSSQHKSHVYMCSLWVLHTNFHCSLKTVPLA